jgi:outer membrane protein OmpA-like peptidoglycan-associated protein
VAAPAPILTWSERLQQEAPTLPRAQVSTAAGSLIITYPQESLFAVGSVLPLAGGAEALDPLAALLRAYPQASWDGQVRAATSNGADYDLALAQKRRELLQRYLRHAGVADERIIWQASSGDGIPLELTLRPPQPLPESSSGVKE